MHFSAIVTVGDEILGGFTQDTNAHWMAARLFRLGFPPRGLEVVGDDPDAIADAAHRWIAHAEVTRLFICGGLGPTPDDRTFEAMARMLKRPLVFDTATGRHIQEMVLAAALAGRLPTGRLGAAARKMAMVPAGGTVLVNPAGMAPGMVYPLDADRLLFVLPGVPRELKAIFTEEIEPRFLNGSSDLPVIVELRYRAAPESAFYTVMKEIEATYPGVAVGSYPNPERRELTIRVRGTSRELVDHVVALLRGAVLYVPLEEVTLP